MCKLRKYRALSRCACCSLDDASRCMRKETGNDRLYIWSNLSPVSLLFLWFKPTEIGGLGVGFDEVKVVVDWSQSCFGRRGCCSCSEVGCSVTDGVAAAVVVVVVVVEVVLPLLPLVAPCLRSCGGMVEYSGGRDEYDIVGSGN